MPAIVDAGRVRQVLENLVSNAVKYTDPGGRIDVRLEVADEVVVITVTDTGIGIPEGDLDRLFDPFFRDHARERMGPGLGLGLGIAQSIVVAHDGRIDVGSTPGEGSTFRITLPTRRSIESHWV